MLTILLLIILEYEQLHESCDLTDKRIGLFSLQGGERLKTLKIASQAMPTGLTYIRLLSANANVLQPPMTQAYVNYLNAVVVSLSYH